MARAQPHRAVPRTQSSAAISSDGQRWFLLNASPDVRDQLVCLPGPETTGTRYAPVEGVVLTDAELDHTLGIVLLREARSLRLYLTEAAQTILERDSRILPLTRSFADVTTIGLALDQRTALEYRNGANSGLWVEPFLVPAGVPRFASTTAAGHTVGLLIGDERTGGTCAFVPGCGGLSPALLRRLEEADLVLFDGTFWHEQELIGLGISDRSAQEMDHLPVSGSHGSLLQLARIARPQKVYTHINNTNPMLIEDSPERASVERAGMTVGSDGMSFSL
jgi:pyrroloquinoline quinone biosynthesis protein B